MSRKHDKIPNILFVCMGNICRSPSAEIIWMSKLSEKKGHNSFHCDSAGTISYHVGSDPDHRMQSALKKEGYKPFGKSRKITKNDLNDFDLILAMDRENLFTIIELAKGDRNLESKCHLFCEYTNVSEASEIPDPYYGGTDGFKKVIHLIEQGCDNLIDSLEV